MMESLKMMFILLACISGCLQFAAGVATSHQSIVSGEGWGYGYGIVHGPHGHGHVTGHSYPHGYGGFGSYAPSYDYNGYGVGHEDLHHVIPVPAIHAPLPVHAEHPPVHAEHLPLLPALPVHEPSLIHYPAKPQVVTPIQAIHPLPHVVPATKPYALPSYASSYHDYGSLLGDHYGDYLSGSLGYGGKYGDLSYGGKYVIGYGGKYGDLSYGGKYGDLSHGGKYGDLVYGGKYGDLFQGGKYGSLSYGNLLSHYYDDDHLLHDYHSYDDLLSDHGHKVVYSGTVGDHYKPYYHDYYGPTSYQH